MCVCLCECRVRVRVRERASPQPVPCDKKLKHQVLFFSFALEAIVFQPAFFRLLPKGMGEGGRGANLVCWFFFFAKTSMRHKQSIYQVYHGKFFNARF